MSKITVSFATALAATMLACCTYKTGREINMAAISDVVIGQSNMEQVETWFGPPSNIFMMATGETWMYTSTKIDIRGSNFIPYANLFNNETDHTSAQLNVSFDRKGIVTDCSYIANASVMQGGIAHNNESIYQQVATGKRCGESSNISADQSPADASSAPVKASNGAQGTKSKGRAR